MKKNFFIPFLLGMICISLFFPMIVLSMPQEYQLGLIKKTPTASATLTLKVGCYQNPPKVYYDFKENKWTGFFPTLVEYIAFKEGWNIQWINGTWDECLQRINSTAIDMMIDVAWDETRAEEYLFNDVSVIENWGTLYTREGLEIDSLYDLEGLSVSVMTGSVHTTGKNGIINLLDRLGISVTYIYNSSNLDVFKTISSGAADVGVVNRLFALYEENNYNVKRTSIFFNPVDLKFIFKLGSTQYAQVISRIDYHLIKMKEDPESIYYYALDKFILGSAGTKEIPQWVYWLIGFAISFAAIASSMSVILKKKVNKKTSALREAYHNLEINEEILLNTLPIGILELDKNGKITSTNEIFQSLYMESFNIELNSRNGMLELGNNELREKLLEIISNKRDFTEDLKSNSLKISLPNNKHYQIFYSPLKPTLIDREPGFIFIFNDITPFIEIEQMRKQFISTVSHELRTPIASINLTLENLINYKDRIRPDQKDYMMDLLNKNAKVLAEMIEDLLIASRIEGNRITLQLQSSDITNLIDEVLAQLSAKIDEKKITITRVGNQKISLNIDPKRIGQVFRIIIDNGIKYSPPNSEVTIETKENGNHQINGRSYQGVLIRISDKGMGIPEKEISKIFTRFYRASNVRTIVGTGLGLSIAKDLVELHQGQILIESKEGMGTTFYIILPNVESKELK